MIEDQPSLFGPDLRPSQPADALRLLDVLGIPLVADVRRLQAVSKHKYRTIYRMFRAYGVGPEAQCRDCEYLVHKSGDFGGKYLKCVAYEGARAGWKARPFGSSVTDWRARWPACGHFERRPPKDSAGKA